jgi:uncharacterized damage-inducible protein DinB
MTDAPRERLTLEPPGPEPEVGRWLAAMEDARRDTLRELDRVTPEMIDWRPDAPINSIGALLYHIALIEADWLLDDIQGRDALPDWASELLPFTDRDDDGRLTRVDGQPLHQHLDRLARIRTFLVDELRAMPPDELHAPRARPRYDVSPAWVLHHLLQHEAEHRSHIAWLRDTFPRD